MQYPVNTCLVLPVQADYSYLGENRVISLKIWILSVYLSTIKLLVLIVIIFCILCWPSGGAIWWSLWQEVPRLQEDWCALWHPPLAPRGLFQANPAPGPVLVHLSGTGSKWNKGPLSLSCRPLHAAPSVLVAVWRYSPEPRHWSGRLLQRTGSSQSARCQWSCRRLLALHWGASPQLDAPSHNRGTPEMTRSLAETPHSHPGSALGSSTWLQPLLSLW